MGRLIDADDAVRRSREASIYDLTDVPEFLAECPTIDAEPVRHGKWIQIWENPNDSNNVICSCSVCGQNNNWYKNILRPYCPNCGAKMDGGTQ